MPLRDESNPGRVSKVLRTVKTSREGGVRSAASDLDAVTISRRGAGNGKVEGG